MTRAAAELMDTDPITLYEASQVILRGKVSVSALRAEISRGNLSVVRIGKNLFTTPAAIREMWEKCRVQPNRLDLNSGKTGSTRTGESDTSGLSATRERTDELAALKVSVTALKNGSLNTLRKSTPRDPQKVGSPIPFPSRR